jgi:hypothetical protein
MDEATGKVAAIIGASALLGNPDEFGRNISNVIEGIKKKKDSEEDISKYFKGAAGISQSMTS